MPRPQKLTFMNGKRVLMDYATRKDEYHNYNKDRWRFQKELKQFYNSTAWRDLSKLVLNEHYYVCAECGKDATLADHIVPVRVDWSLRLDKNNIQPLCDSCHAIKTRKEREIYNN